MLNHDCVNWRKLSAVDGRYAMSQGTYNYDPRIATIRHDRPMSSGEIGCFLSHVKALELFLDGTEKHAIILEDDADLPEGVIAKIVAIAQRLDTEFPENWDSFNFSAATKGYQYPVFSEQDTKILRCTYMPCGLPGQLWSRTGAIAYLNSRFAKYVMGPVDREMRSHFARRGRSFIPGKPLTSRVNFKSDIDASEDRWLTSGKPLKTSIRCKVMRHFPDYLNATIKINQARLGLL